MKGYLAQVILFASADILPMNWAYCNGQTLHIAENRELFGILGIAYGGDGKTTFKLPELEAPLFGMKYIICTKGKWVHALD